MSVTEKTCPCGRPLHYSSPERFLEVERLVERLGELQQVRVTGVGAWRVPRHYIALHGLKGHELPRIAEQYGFEKVI